jgi:hypothetical protein
VGVAIFDSARLAAQSFLWRNPRTNMLEMKLDLSSNKFTNNFYFI